MVSFTGNEAPAASVDILNSEDGSAPTVDDPRVSLCRYLLHFSAHQWLQWKEILPKVKLGPDFRHLFTVSPSEGVNYVKLNMYPDGGIVSRVAVATTKLTD